MRRWRNDWRWNIDPFMPLMEHQMVPWREKLCISIFSVSFATKWKISPLVLVQNLRLCHKNSVHSADLHVSNPSSTSTQAIRHLPIKSASLPFSITSIALSADTQKSQSRLVAGGLRLLSRWTLSSLACGWQIHSDFFPAFRFTLSGWNEVWQIFAIYHRSSAQFSGEATWSVRTNRSLTRNWILKSVTGPALTPIC